MRFKQLSESYIDNQSGKGVTPNNMEIDYFGLRVMVKPSTFLSLAEPLSRQNADSTDWIKDYLQKGGKIASPFLKIAIPDEWINGDYSKPARVNSHDGRNRMYALKELQGDNPIEVHLLFNGTWRKSHITDSFVQALNRKIIPEWSRSTSVSGPWFLVK